MGYACHDAWLLCPVREVTSGGVAAEHQLTHALTARSDKFLLTGWIKVLRSAQVGTAAECDINGMVLCSDNIWPN